VRGEYAVRINRSAAAVFDVLADGTRNPSWRKTVVEISLHSGDGGEGSVWRQVVRGPAGKAVDADYRVTRFEPAAAYGFDIIAGPMRGIALYTLTSHDDGETSVSLELILKPRGAMRILTGFVLRRLVDELDSLDRLRALLDTPTGTVTWLPP
jgi:uncharacterized protein YndB with AHSA1/START domain